MPIAARSADRVDLPAGLAGVEHGAEFACAARSDRVQHLLVLPGHGGAEPLEILPAVGLSQMRRTGADSFTSGRNGRKRVATHVLR